MISRVIFLDVFAPSPNTGTTSITDSEQCPFDGRIQEIQISTPPSNVGKLSYGITLNSESIYPSNGFISNSNGSNDVIQMDKSVIIGDFLSLIVNNSDPLLPYEITAKIILVSE